MGFGWCKIKKYHLRIILKMADERDANPVDGSVVIQQQTVNANLNDVRFTSKTCSTEIKISQRKVKDEKYDIKKGIAVVINNIEFDRHLNLPDRKGSDVDASSLFQRFQELGFDSDLLNDATKNDVIEKIEEIKNEDLKQVDCLLFVFLTHGSEDGIFTTDGEMKIKTVMEYFNAENCKDLALKPKIFIFQACRGPDIGRGINARVTGDPNQADAAADTKEYDEVFGDIVRIPNEADFLAIYSSSMGYGSFRNTEKGSPFVRVLSEELLNMKKGEDFYKVLTRVNRKVGTGYKPNLPNRNDITQMPCFVSHLTKDLILKP